MHAAQSPAQTDVSAAVLEALALPRLDTLDSRQVRGGACVWDADERLTIETAVDLGERTTEQDGCQIRWFPRGCRSCVATRARHGLVTHAGACEQCADEAAVCPVGRALYRLVREGRR